jgi:hypothetical protein
MNKNSMDNRIIPIKEVRDKNKNFGSNHFYP